MMLEVHREELDADHDEGNIVCPSTIGWSKHVKPQFIPTLLT